MLKNAAEIVFIIGAAIVAGIVLYNWRQKQRAQATANQQSAMYNSYIESIETEGEVNNFAAFVSQLGSQTGTGSATGSEDVGGIPIGTTEQSSPTLMS